MKKFIVIYHAPLDAVKEMAAPDAIQQKANIETWMKWAQDCGSHLEDMGSPLSGGQTLRKDGQSTDSNKEVTGYSVLRAEDMPEAIALLRQHPHLTGDDSCYIELHEIMAIPGM